MEISKFTSKYNTETKEVEYKIMPKVTNYNDVMFHIGNLMSSVPQALAELLLTLPMCRDVTQQEKDIGAYIFINESEQKLYKTRSNLYDTLSNTFNQLFNQLFADVLYVRECKAKYEEFAFEHTEDEVEEFKKDLEALKFTVLDELKKEVDTDEVQTKE